MAAALAAAKPAQQEPPPPPMFTNEERWQVVMYWMQPDRYSAQPLGDVEQKGRFYVRFTPEGSTWIRDYFTLRNPVKTDPTKPPPPLNEQQLAWDAWLDSRLKQEKDEAQVQADAMNKGDEPPIQAVPDAVPDDLALLLPPPPAFYAVVVPYVHTVKFDDVTLTYQDHVAVRDKFAYYRNEKGVTSAGEKISQRSPDELKTLFDRAQISPTEQHVFQAVSLLEGGFDAVNTYDTGFVSVGFIQFASLADAAGSLGQVLLQMKQDSPDDFQANFRSYGVDVTEDGVLVVIDPTTGTEFAGADANRRVIIDKRLTAVFQRAGEVSDAFDVAQLVVAKRMYYPADDVVTVQAGDKTLTAQVKDIFQTEAGLATLMDRKVNTGNISILTDYLTDLVAQTGMTDLRQASKYEWALTRAVQFRRSFLDDLELTQPQRSDIALSRGNNPRDRRGGG